MTPDPRLIPFALRLPLDARRRLAAQEGPGWWVAPTGYQDPLRARPTDAWDVDVEHRLSSGWLWYPASEVAWMEAAAGPDGRWQIGGSSYAGDAVIELPGEELKAEGMAHGRFWTTHRGSSAPECALRAWGVMP